ncbi:MAG: 16S rRNA (uracil(1498)-N(3))-methyltransferase [Gammaproteobacteria bacterium]|nr:16S rRNA (uracil(1498)-N(3))-methyltransferase [Gammaproteobacteria bacterium]
MRIPRVYVPDIPRRAEQRAHPLSLSELASRHVSTVLRLKPGAPLVLFDGRGHSYEATLRSARRNRVEVDIEGEPSIEPANTRPLTLAVCIARGERMDVSVQKATELGVSVIQPIISERTVVRVDASRTDRKLGHWEAVMIAACEQSGRSWLADVREPCDLDRWLSQCAERDTPDSTLDLMLDCEAAQNLPELARRTPEPGAISMLIGPEGGFSEDERARAHSAGLQPVRFGPRVLRAETAAIAAMACVQMHWGDLR